MKKSVIGYCPICNEKLLVKTLYCKHCDTELTGSFTMSPFDYLSNKQLEFALVFIKNKGNIKQIEKELNISYPTVKKNIDDLVDALGFNNVVRVDIKPSRDSVLRKLKNKEINIEEAERLI